MKTCTSYNLKLTLNEQGEVQNSQCECPVGKGVHATCKHVTAILLVLIGLRNLGQLNVKKSCTETLQGFQKPRKSHGGSPMAQKSASRAGMKIHENLSTKIVQAIGMKLET